MPRLFLPLLCLFLLFGLSACATGTGTGIVSGTLDFNGEYPPINQRITLDIYDYTQFADEDFQPVLIGRAYVPVLGTKPIPYAIAYDKSLIVPKNIYVVYAYVSGGDDFLWRSTPWNVVITQGRPTDEVHIILDPEPPTPSERE
jgi:hypothetical protein